METQDPVINRILQQVDPAKAEWRRKMQEREHRQMHLFHHIGEGTSKPAEFLIDGFLPEGYVAILAGDPKIGKTAMASAIALAIAEGTPFAGMETRRSGVLWLALEESDRERATVMQPVQARLKETDFFVTYQKVAIDTDEGLDDIYYWVKEADARFIVIDPLHAAHSGRSLSDGWSARRTIAPLKEFCFRRNVTALVLHHIGRRNRRVAENAQLAACAGMSMLLTMSKVGDERLIKLRCAGRGDFANRTWHFASAASLDYRQTDPPEREPPLQREKPFPMDDQIVEILNASAHAFSAAGIADRLKRNPNAIRNSLARLCATERIRLAYISGRTKYYAHNINTAESEHVLATDE